MKVGIMGTGVVAQTIAAKLADLGHSVVIGTRDVRETLSRTAPDVYGNPPCRVWLEAHPKVKLLDYPGAAAHGEILVNATSGGGTLEALKAAGKVNMEGKILVDIANPLDFSKGMPPSLTVCNTDSLGEQIQRAFPGTHVVKTLNTVNTMLMVDPGRLAGGDHHMFICGNNAEAKQKVGQMLTAWFGWKHILDLGDITNARATEMLLPIWVRLYGSLKTPVFNFKVVQ
jgi:8-hydroxy-5-deazaflavin:NADPH oxidoreductase